MSGLLLQLEDVPVVQVPQAQELPDVCYCALGCDNVEYAFADNGGDFWKKDQSSFLARKIGSSDTITIQIFKDGTQVATVNALTPYGTYYPSFTAQPLYIGWLADWTAIYNAFGGGTYYINFAYNILGNTFDVQSRYFQLMQYAPELADRTVRIEGYQTGNIEGNEFDFTNLISGGWYQSIRLKGWFGDREARFEIDNYENSAREIIQNRTKMSFAYTLHCELIPTSTFAQVISNNLLANTIEITDYRLNRDPLDIVRRKSVMLEDVTEQRETSNGQGMYNITFVDRFDNIIKRNF